MRNKNLFNILFFSSKVMRISSPNVHFFTVKPLHPLSLSFTCVKSGNYERNIECIHANEKDSRVYSPSELYKKHNILYPTYCLVKYYGKDTNAVIINDQIVACVGDGVTERNVFVRSFAKISILIYIDLIIITILQQIGKIIFN